MHQTISGLVQLMYSLGALAFANDYVSKR